MQTVLQDIAQFLFTVHVILLVGIFGNVLQPVRDVTQPSLKFHQGLAGKH